MDDLRRNASRFAEELADRGRDVADRGRSAYHRLTSNRPDPVDEVRAIAGFAVGALALIGVGYLITRVVRSRRSRPNDRAGRLHGGSRETRRQEPTHQLLARLDSPEAIARHNEEIRLQHASGKESSERSLEHSSA